MQTISSEKLIKKYNYNKAGVFFTSLILVSIVIIIFYLCIIKGIAFEDWQRLAFFFVSVIVLFFFFVFMIKKDDYHTEMKKRSENGDLIIHEFLEDEKEER